MENTWIKLYRKLLESQIFENEKLLKIWIWILLKANHKDNTVLFGREKILIKRGQFIMGLNKSSDTLNMAKSTIHYWVNYLASIGKVKLKKTTKYTVITIDNYNFYQDIELKKNSKKTLKETNKNDKNEKNEEDIYISETSSQHKKEETFNFDKILLEMETDIKRPLNVIIANYWKYKGSDFKPPKTKEQYRSILLRELSWAKKLEPYDIEDIKKTMYDLNSSGLEWSLKAVLNWIDKDRTKIINFK